MVRAVVSRKEAESPLLVAARALDAELQAFELSARMIGRAPLESQRQIERAGQLLGQVGEGEARLAERLGALIQALDAANAARQVHMSAIQARAGEIEARVHELQRLMGLYQALGLRAHAINAGLNDRLGEGGTPLGIPELEAVETDLSALLTDADALMIEARQAGFIDVLKLTESLRQQLANARGKLRKALKR